MTEPAPPRGALKRSLRWRVLLVLSLAAVVPTVVVGVLAILRARADVRDEVQRGALAHIRALGAALDGTLRPGPEARLLYGDPVPPGVDIGADSFGGYIGDAVFVHGRPTVHLVVQARGRTGELMGVFVASLDLGFVRDLITQARLGRGARVIVVDGTGVPVASSEPHPPPATSLAGKDPAVDRALASSVEGTLSAHGVVSAYRNLSSYQTLRGVRWAILHQQPEAQAYALARRTTRDALLVGGAALAVALALGAFFATKLTRPLADLARRADAIAAGHGAEGPPVRGPGEIGVLAGRLDEMAQRIAERAELAAALARGDRLASVGVMSAQVAHEINNPLTTVLGYAKLLQEDKPDGHPDRAALELIADEAERMKKIIGGLLEYARAPRASAPDTAVSTGSAGAGAAEPEAVVRHVAALVAPQLRKAGATLTSSVLAAAPVAIEASALQQVLVNLVQNAAQAGATKIAIEVSARPGDVASELAVIDNGPGVPAADHARVFDPFFTTKAAGTGTGLGLAVCRHLVATAGGSIEVGDAPGGRGAAFRVILPRAKHGTETT